MTTTAKLSRRLILVLFVMEVSVGVVEGTVEEGGGVLLVEGVEGGDGIVA